MNTLSQPLTHGNAYTEDETYEQCYGLVGAPRKTICYNWTIRRWQVMTVQPLRTSAERIDLVDPDAAMEPEPWSEPVRTRTQAAEIARAANQVKAQERNDLAEQRVTAYLREHGMVGMAELVSALGYQAPWLAKHMQYRNGTVYFYVRRGKLGALWGLVGVHDGING